MTKSVIDDRFFAKILEVFQNYGRQTFQEFKVIFFRLYPPKIIRRTSDGMCDERNEIFVYHENEEDDLDKALRVLIQRKWIVVLDKKHSYHHRRSLRSKETEDSVYAVTPKGLARIVSDQKLGK